MLHHSLNIEHKEVYIYNR